MSNVTMGKSKSVRIRYRLNPLKLLRTIFVLLAVAGGSYFFIITASAKTTDLSPTVVHGNFQKVKIEVKSEEAVAPLVSKTQEEIDETENHIEQVEEWELYNPQISMPLEHQRYLYDKCQERELDYKQTLGLIKHESMFNVYAIAINKKTFIERFSNAQETEKALEKLNAVMCVSDGEKTYYSVNKGDGIEYYQTIKDEESEELLLYKVVSADFSYFQINTVNHCWLSEQLNTANNPLDPYINIDWGTYYLSYLNRYWRMQGYKGEQLEEAVLSSYNKGITGYRKHGKAVNYMRKVQEAQRFVSISFANMTKDESTRTS